MDRQDTQMQKVAGLHTKSMASKVIEKSDVRPPREECPEDLGQGLRAPDLLRGFQVPDQQRPDQGTVPVQEHYAVIPVGPRQLDGRVCCRVPHIGHHGIPDMGPLEFEWVRKWDMRPHPGTNLARFRLAQIGFPH
jgi:hypothetical protein